MQIRISIPDDTAAQITKITKDTGLSVPQVFQLMWVIYKDDLSSRLAPVPPTAAASGSPAKAASPVKPTSALDMLESLI